MNHNIYRTSIILYFIGLSGYLFNFLFNALLANHISNELYGDFSVAFRILNIFSIYILLGTMGGAKRFYSHYVKINDVEKASRYIGWNMRVVFFSFSIFCFLLSIFSFSLFGLHLFRVHDIREYHLLVYFLFLSPINAVGLLISAYLICDRDVYLGAFFDFSGFYFFGLFVLFFLIYCFHIILHRELLWVLTFFTFILMALFQFLFLIKRVPHLLKKGFSFVFNLKKSDNHIEKEWWLVSKRLTMNQLVYQVVRAADLLLLEWLSPNQKTVGYYAAALTISGVFLVTQTALFQLSSSLFSTLASDPNKKHQLQKLVDESNHMNITLNFLLILIIVVFSKFILGFFGGEFLVAKIPLWILLSGVAIGVVTSSANRLLAYTGHEIYLFYIAAIEIMMTIIFGFLLIKFYGMIGAALTVLLITLFKSIASVYLVRKKLQIRSAVLC